ncbi:MAG: SpoIID/LytB domain-containing protein [Candidatus Zhuqueibacterota bacterium]
MFDHSHADSDHKRTSENFTTDDMPVLKIGFEEERDLIEFKSSGRFTVLNNQGMPILKDVTSPMKWRVKVEQKQPARYSFGVLVGKFDDKSQAQELEYQLIEKGIGTRIKTRGGKLYCNEAVVNDNTQYWVTVDNYATEQKAVRFAREMLSGFDYQIITEKVNQPHAVLELFDSEFEKLGEAENVIRIVPEADDVTTYIYDVIPENEVQTLPVRQRMFRRTLEFRASADGKLTIICEIPLEKYVESIVAFEMKSDYPEELIKAQAIAVRSKTLASLGIKHYDDPFHLCAGPHCQTFNGLTRTSEAIEKAVKATAGIVLKDNKKVVDAHYTLICGGHTESSHCLYSIENEEQYPPVFDGREPRQLEQIGDLSVNENLRQWASSEPDVFCNVTNYGNHIALNYLKKYFHWQVTYERRELEEIVSAKIGENIGDIFDIIPIRRGVSGRILELEILGSNRNLILKTEWEIRHTLAADLLFSSCFVINRQFDEDGFPLAFSFLGVGHGHGVGLCQAGGIVMALKKASYNDILNHYFRNTKPYKIY